LDLPPADYLARLHFNLTKRVIHYVRGKDISPHQFPQFVKAEDRSITSRIYLNCDDMPANVSPYAFYMVQQPVHWTREYRCFVVGDSIVTASGYAKDGEEWR